MTKALESLKSVCLQRTWAPYSGNQELGSKLFMCLLTVYLYETAEAIQHVCTRGCSFSLSLIKIPIKGHSQPNIKKLSSKQCSFKTMT